MLLTPNRQPFIIDNLGSQNAIDTLIKGFLQTLFECFVHQVAIIRRTFFCHITNHLQRVHHRIIIEGDVNLIPLRVGPELGPPAVLILSAEQIVNTLAESVAVTLIAGALIESSQES